jgi:hypothetical protein
VIIVVAGTVFPFSLYVAEREAQPGNKKGEKERERERGRRVR